MFEKLENYIAAGKTILYYVNSEIESCTSCISDYAEKLKDEPNDPYYTEQITAYKTRLEAYETMKQAIVKVVKSAV